MYFVQLRNLREFDYSLLKNFDNMLKSLHSSSQYITPQQIQRDLNITKDDSFKLLFRARDIGVVNTVKVSKCVQCGRTTKTRGLTKNCPRCDSSNLKNGYYFTTEAYKYICN